ncbi:PLP-dependent aminotransferase family protein [Mycobacterium sp. 1274761.0]|uniref:MocR-like pyridoxine biosynthesis transcription factor PdxR n=1 Tax=Mycobacterium sp. 1274761.0 TaxID=1834077 RepID=UPI0007FE302D|nr:PLP-dependent aminotransferase family protein [Mycobacterium sp. 1274761.0]OBK73980.1 hypothetical protein A5651_11775 [Mycobacterium sp. 1274761.0]
MPADILLNFDRRDRRKLSEHLRHQLRAAIQQGRLSAGTVLPPSRTLASDLGVARSVVVAAYEHLIADGYLDARQGSGTQVLPIAPAAGHNSAAIGETGQNVRLIGGLPDPSLFPRSEWLQHYRTALHLVPHQQLGYPGPQGAAALREALADYVSRVRGVAGSAGRMVITTGMTQAIVLVCRALQSRGATAVAIEDPCFGFHRQAISSTGMRVVPIPVDDDGLLVEKLFEHEVNAILLSPAHSYPSGAVLSTSRRASLIAWAKRHDGLIIEDDYDAEFRYDRAPIGAIQGLDPERVIYAGCASKMLTPALRLGWALLPAQWVDPVVEQKLVDDMGTPLLEQLALARFIESGALTRHLRRVRPVYRRRRDRLLDTLKTALPGAEISGVAAGLHVYVRLPPSCDERRFIKAARDRGVFLEGASWHWSDSNSAPPALVLGYGSISESAIQTAISTLGSIVEPDSVHGDAP